MSVRMQDNAESIENEEKLSGNTELSLIPLKQMHLKLLEKVKNTALRLFRQRKCLNRLKTK